MLGKQLSIIAQYFADCGIVDWVISPGSRNAPIVAALIKNRSFNFYSSPDERSAAFTAMGMAISNGKPAGFLCTSGSALSNAYPAVLESYYSRVPLLIVSADRPEELIDQWDGQTIRQKNFFGNYVRSFAHINARYDKLQNSNQNIKKCISISTGPISGPVHINISLSEPIYEGIEDQKQIDSQNSNVNSDTLLQEYKLDYDLSSEIQSSKQIALIIGQGFRKNDVSTVLESLATKIPVFADITSGYSEIGLTNWDWGLLKRIIPDNLKPDLIITLGMGIISKPLKLAMRKWSPEHLHVSEASEIGDPFQTQPKHLPFNEIYFLRDLNKLLIGRESNFLNNWNSFIESQILIAQELPIPFNLELCFVQDLIKNSDENYHLHFGNSMSVRYASWSIKGASRIFSNRGVSGIDGCISTALGDALVNPDKKIIVIAGDITSLYDANSFWGDWPINFHLIILNNHGGAIFDWIDGPNKLPDLRNFIHTPHSKSFNYLAQLHKKSFQKVELQSQTITLNEILNTQVIELVTQ